MDVKNLPGFAPKTLKGDSVYYEILHWAAGQLKDVPGLTCEIGLRMGGGTESIVQGSIDAGDPRVHVAIDPYGDIEYRMSGRTCRMDYTNQMKVEALAEIYAWFKAKGRELLFFNMEDTEFFRRFADGVPVYDRKKTLVNSYALVHVDGPHAVGDVRRAIEFFTPRTPLGGIWVFDDVNMYPHEELVPILTSAGMWLEILTGRKIAYRRMSL